MKRKLSIRIYKPDNTCIEHIICEKLDACRSMTIMSHSYIVDKNNSTTGPGNDYHLAESMDHFNMFEGLITIYYKSGFYMEINRIYG
jgi:hypothetical protein